jgi:hemolysin III
VTGAVAAAVRPRQRGLLHQWAFVGSAVLTCILLLVADHAEGRLSLGLYAVCVTGLFGVSALYHRRLWSPAARRWMRRLDHSMIFLLIAGTYTPFAVLALGGTTATVLLIVLWSGALVGVGITLLWIDAPHWLVAVVCAVLGWAAVAALPGVADSLGWGAVVLIAAGGVLYSAGAAAYALKRPDPVPTVFGYHEVFHLLVVLAALAHYLAIVVYLVPRS